MNLECLASKTGQSPEVPRNLIGLSLDELEDLVRLAGWEEYRARQIASWIYQKGVHHFREMTNLSRTAREYLQETFSLNKLKLIEKRVSSADGTTKFLFELHDGEKIESVFMPTDTRRTLCVSTQVGCPLKCHFCMTGQMGFRRDLETGEILDQVISCNFLLSQDLPLSPNQHPITNVVFMGMGEPLLNWPKTSKAIRILQSDSGPAIGSRKITVSTSGVAEKILELALDETKFKLAISLNAADNGKRSYLMPINKKFPLEQLIRAVQTFTYHKKERVTFEYILIDSFNDSLADARRLADLIKGIPCKVNLIPCNQIPGQSFKSPSDDVINQFQDYLYRHCPAVTLRQSRGRDIWGACGQLRACY